MAATETASPSGLEKSLIQNVETIAIGATNCTQNIDTLGFCRMAYITIVANTMTTRTKIRYWLNDHAAMVRIPNTVAYLRLENAIMFVEIRIANKTKNGPACDSIVKPKQKANVITCVSTYPKM